MIVIKRYPNRKLYNTQAKQYVTLDGIAQLIRDGEEAQILDHATGEDLTAVTLTQIIVEQEKKEGGFLPRPVLTGLIQSGGQTLASLRRSLASSLDLLHHVDQEIARRVQLLVDSGELEPEEGFRLQKQLQAVGQRSQETAYPSEEALERILEERGVPTQDELQLLNDRLDELVAKLEIIAPRSD